MSDAEQARGFARALLGDPGDHPWLAGSHVTVWTAPGRHTEWLPADDADRLAQAVVDADERVAGDGGAVYVGLAVAPLPEPDPARPRHTQRVRAADTSGLLALFLDIDIEGRGDHATVTDDGRGRLPYPPSESAAHGLIDEMGLPPSMVVHTGHGLAAYWVFHEPWAFDQPGDGDGERGEASTLVRSWVATARVRAGSHGWRVDPVGDLARVMRVPGSTNRKRPDDPRPVRIVADSGARYNPSDFAGYLADQEAIRQMIAPPIKIDSGVLRGVDITAVYARCNSALYRSARFVPEWLEYTFDASERLRRTWHGQVAEHGGDGSTIDASVVRQLADAETPVELIVEAIICRRMRFERGKAAAKVDPAERVDYLVRTLSKFIATSQAAREQREARTVEARDEARSDIDKALDEAAAETSDETGEAVVAAPSSAGGPDGADEPATVAVIPDPDPDDLDPDTVAPVVTAVPADVTDRVTGAGDTAAWRPTGLSSGALRAVAEQGERSVVESIPIVPDVDDPSPEDREVLADLAAQLNLERGYLPWAVLCRTHKKGEQHRLVVKRMPGSRALPGRVDWAVGQVRATHWRGVSTWQTPATVKANIRADLHIGADPPRGWAGDGVEAWFGVVREVADDTPVAAVVTAVRELLVAHCPLAPFSLARRDGHAWLEADAADPGADDPDDRPVVSVSLALIERRVRELREHSPLTPEEIMDVIKRRGATVHRGVTVREAGHLIRDSRTWVRVPAGLLTDADWKAVRAARESYAAERAATRPQMVTREDHAR